jgi:hypothetical protein
MINLLIILIFPGIKIQAGMKKSFWEMMTYPEDEKLEISASFLGDKRVFFFGMNK